MFKYVEYVLPSQYSVIETEKFRVYLLNTRLTNSKLTIYLVCSCTDTTEYIRNFGRQ